MNGCSHQCVVGLTVNALNMLETDDLPATTFKRHLLSEVLLCDLKQKRVATKVWIMSCLYKVYI